MGTLMVPAYDDEPWPTLGRQVCQLLEERCVHGPGDLKGRRYTLDDDKRALIYRAYEVYPRGHPMAGRRRFKKFGISLRKGTAKTELAAAIAFAELHPEGPVRADGWHVVDGEWEPVGRPVHDPYIPMVAYTEEQTEDLAYAALYVMCAEGEDADCFDVGLDRILRLDRWGIADGKAVALASSPDSRDGARTTFQHFDETHRFVLPRLVDARETMLQNIPKRMQADAWSLSTTTTHTPGQGSVDESDYDEAKQIAKGEIVDGTIAYYYRFATPRPDENLDDPEQLRAAIREATGPAIMGWAYADHQVESIASLYHQAKRRGNAAYFERVWLNRRRQSSRQAFDAGRWRDELARVGLVVGKREPICIGFDGSRWGDSTGMVASTLGGHQFVLGVWQHDGSPTWEVPEHEVDQVLHQATLDYTLVRFYGDPAMGWDSGLSRWAGKYGPKKIVAFYTDSRNTRKIALVMAAYTAAQRGGELTHDGNADMADHIGNARRRDTKLVDDDKLPLWLIEKERHDSPFKIDLAMAGALSWQARLDAIAAGEMKPRPASRMLVRR